MPEENKSQDLSAFQMAKLIYEAREQLGWKISDSAELSNRIKLLELGLPKEDEFIAVVSWLGKCRLIHKLNQEQYPHDSREFYQPPDLVAVFEHESRRIPTLIEVKTSEKKLSWKPNYFDKLKRYAELIELPLLVAWKYRIKDTGLAFWALFDAEVFTNTRGKYEIDFETAFNETLLGQLGGDFLIDVKAGVGRNFDFFPIGDKSDWQRAYHSGGSLFGQMKMYYTDGNGNRITDKDDSRLTPGFAAIIECVPFLSEYYAYTAESSIHFGWKLEHNQALFAHQIMPMLLTQQAHPDSGLNWNSILRQEGLLVSAREIYEAANNESVSGPIFHQIPKTAPAFM